MDISKKLVREKTNNWSVQLFRYVFVGGLSFIVDYSVLYILTDLCGWYYLISATAAFIAGLFVNYFISIRWVFLDSKLQNKAVEFSLYGIIGVIGLILTNLLMFLFTDLLNIHYMGSKLVTAAIVLIWNFVGRRFILFK